MGQGEECVPEGSRAAGGAAVRGQEEMEAVLFDIMRSQGYGEEFFGRCAT